MSRVARAYVISAALILFFLSWAAIAAKPWKVTKPKRQDPRLTALAVREKSLRIDAKSVQSLVARRWRVHQRRLRARERQIEAARRDYEQQLAAARAAAARIAAQRAAAASFVSYSAPASSGAAAAPASGGGRVVTLPPQVRIVTLPPVANTKSS